jgi:hypothetical protein
MQWQYPLPVHSSAAQVESKGLWGRRGTLEVCSGIGLMAPRDVENQNKFQVQVVFPEQGVVTLQLASLSVTVINARSDKSNSGKKYASAKASQSCYHQAGALYRGRGSSIGGR